MGRFIPMPASTPLPSHARSLSREDWERVLASLDWVCESAPKAPSPAYARWMSKNSHSHDYDEIVVSLVGTHDYGMNGRAIPLSPGRAALIPARTSHDFWYGKFHAPCVDFWFHILPHGKVSANYTIHHPARELVCIPVPFLAVQFQEEFAQAATLLRVPGDIPRKKALHFLLYLLHETFEFLMTTEIDHPADNDFSVIDDIKIYAAKHLTDRLTLQDLAKAAGYSPFHFHRIFLESEGVTPRAFVESRRLKHACDLLKTGRTITSAAMDSGFSTSSQFATVFKKKFGIPPTEWLKTTPR